MKTTIIYRILSVISIIWTVSVHAQTLPLMPSDPSVKHEILPDGLSCYVVANPSEKGFADVVLLRRDYSGNDIVSQFRNVTVSGEAADSTLIEAMKMVAAAKTPADMALIVSGDVVSAEILKKLRYMSYMIPASDPHPQPEYEWSGDSGVRCEVSSDTLKGLSTVSFKWHAPRTPHQYMNTVQSAIYDKAVRQLDIVLCRYLRSELQRLDIPVADVSFRHRGSRTGFSDEAFTFSVTVSEENAAVAERTAAGILALIDSQGVRIGDLLLAEEGFMSRLASDAGHEYKDNSEYVALCRNAFLYNSALSGPQERFSFFGSKEVADSVNLNMFSAITSALLEADSLSAVPAVQSAMCDPHDIVAFPAAGLKTKVSARKDPVSGGIMWTFANGFKVVYKKMPTDRVLYYSLSLNGGYAAIDSLNPGEGAYISDCLEDFWISGLKRGAVTDMLRMSGLTMDTRVNLSNTIISGRVKDRNVELLMRTLLALANESRPDTAEFSYYTRCEEIRLKHAKGGVRDLRAAIDSLMCPGYSYSSHKSEGGLSSSTLAKADAFMKEQTAKMNDGVLVLVGDMDESVLKKTLQMYVGGFRTKTVAFKRPVVQYQPLSGSSTIMAPGKRDALVVAVSAPVVMTAKNYFAADLATTLVEHRLQDIFSEPGVVVRVRHSADIYPRERYSMMIEITGADQNPALTQVRRVLAGLAEENVDGTYLKALKEYLKQKYALKMQEPEYWLKAVSLRHLDGKDFTSGYAGVIDSLSASDVNDLFGALLEGSRIEYIVKE